MVFIRHFVVYQCLHILGHFVTLISSCCLSFELFVQMFFLVHTGVLQYCDAITFDLSNPHFNLIFFQYTSFTFGQQSVELGMFDGPQFANYRGLQCSRHEQFLHGVNIGVVTSWLALRMMFKFSLDSLINVNITLDLFSFGNQVKQTGSFLASKSCKQDNYTRESEDIITYFCFGCFKQVDILGKCAYLLSCQVVM